MAALLALGISMPTVGANVVPTNMAFSVGADDTRSGCCDDHSDADDTGMGACLLICLAGAQAVLPGDIMTTFRGAAEIGSAPQAFAGTRTVHPDPGPPKTIALG